MVCLPCVCSSLAAGPWGMTCPLWPSRRLKFFGVARLNPPSLQWLQDRASSTSSTVMRFWNTCTTTWRSRVSWWNCWLRAVFWWELHRWAGSSGTPTTSGFTTRVPWSESWLRLVGSESAAFTERRCATCFRSASPGPRYSFSRSGRRIFGLHTDGVGGAVQDVRSIDGGPGLHRRQHFGLASGIQPEDLRSLDYAGAAAHATRLVDQNAEPAGGVHPPAD